MTAPFESEFRAKLPPAARSALRETARVTGLLYRANIEQGWTMDQLVAECSRDLTTAANVGAVITSRLEHCAANRPAAGPTLTGRTRPFCSDDCRARGGWIEDEHGTATGRCPCRTGEAAV